MNSERRGEGRRRRGPGAHLADWWLLVAMFCVNVSSMSTLVIDDLKIVYANIYYE